MLGVDAEQLVENVGLGSATDSVNAKVDRALSEPTQYREVLLRAKAVKCQDPPDYISRL